MGTGTGTGTGVGTGTGAFFNVVGVRAGVEGDWGVGPGVPVGDAGGTGCWDRGRGTGGGVPSASVLAVGWEGEVNRV